MFSNISSQAGFNAKPHRHLNDKNSAESQVPDEKQPQINSEYQGVSFKHKRN